MLNGFSLQWLSGAFEYYNSLDYIVTAFMVKIHIHKATVAVKWAYPMQRTWYNVEYVVDVMHF